MSLEQPKNDPMNLDFTSPQTKLTDLEKNIETIERAIKYAQKLNDNERVAELQKKLDALNKTVPIVKEDIPQKPEKVVEVANDSYDWGSDGRASATR